MIPPYRLLLDDLLRIDCVSLAMLVGRDDGIIIDCAGPGSHREATAAFAAALFTRVGRASIAAGIGDAVAARAEATNGHICVVGSGQMALVVIAGRGVNLGRLRIEMRQGLERAP